MINSHLLYRLSYRGTDDAHFTKNPIKVNVLDRTLTSAQTAQASRMTVAIALATWSMLPSFSAATQMRPLLTA